MPKTKGGHRVLGLTKVNDKYIGIVEDKPLIWSIDGRRGGQRSSKYDLELKKYAITRRWGNRITESVVDALPNRPRGVLEIKEL